MKTNLFQTCIVTIFPFVNKDLIVYNVFAHIQNTTFIANATIMNDLIPFTRGLHWP